MHISQYCDLPTSLGSPGLEYGFYVTYNANALDTYTAKPTLLPR
jgi:hypothetical protein